MSAWMSNLRDLPGRFVRSVSYVGLIVATLFFAASLTPSLLPRHFAVQGLLSGLALSVGYGLGVAMLWLGRFLELPRPAAGVERAAQWLVTPGAALLAGYFLWQATVWQNSIRQLMEMEPVATAYPWRVAGLALLVGVALLLVARGLGRSWAYTDRWVSRLIPRRVSYVVSTLLLVVAVTMLFNKLVLRTALDMADAVFMELDSAVAEGLAPPTDALASGSGESLIAWDELGRQGRSFVAGGPTADDISRFWGSPARRPLRVYVGLAAGETKTDRAALALDELIRVGGFERSVLIVANPTGTGWLDPGAVDTLEYLHQGDTAIVSVQYSYLPSWITLLVDPHHSRDSARALFDAVYNHWITLPADARPKLYVHGLSLGALGSESSADLFTIFEQPIQGGVWSGPPFPSSVWARATAARQPDSPMWLPEFRDGSLLRFTSQKNNLHTPERQWGPMRFVYVQYASDPMTFFSPDLLYRHPQWLGSQRGPDVSPYLRWYPIVTFLQVGFDLPMATSVPTGYGHNFAPAHYIDAWMAVTEPAGAPPDVADRLKQHFAAP